MTTQRFTVSTTATGTRRSVVVFVYDTAEELQAAAIAFRPGTAGPSTAGVTHGLAGVTPAPAHRRVLAIVRLCRSQLNAEIVTHEMTHAAATIYCYDMVRPHSRAMTHFHAANEPLAYLVSDLTGRTYETLHRLGYY